MTRDSFWTDEATDRLIRWHEADAKPHEIARKMCRTEWSVRTKLNMLKAAGRIAEKAKETAARKPEKAVAAPGARPPDRTIVDMAKYWLLYVGYTERQIACMKLDEIMFEANTRLHRWGMPQLGAKKEWLVRG